MIKAYRARILSFDAQAAPSDSARLDEDGLLVIGANEQGRQVVQMVGDYNLLADEFKARYQDSPRAWPAAFTQDSPCSLWDFPDASYLAKIGVGPQPLF